MAKVHDDGDSYCGTIDLSCAPDRVRALFEEFEEIVNNQQFSYLDAIQEQIRMLQVKAVINGCEAPVEDLQAFPSDGVVSFKLAAPIAS